MTGNQSGNESARNLLPEKRPVRISVCALRCQGAGKIRTCVRIAIGGKNCSASDRTNRSSKRNRRRGDLASIEQVELRHRYDAAGGRWLHSALNVRRPLLAEMRQDGPDRVRYAEHVHRELLVNAIRRN